MKTTYIISSLIVFLVFGYTTTHAQLFKTNLKITVLEGTDQPVTEAEVKLYTSEENYRSSTNPVFNGKTNKKGQVKIKKLKPRAYYLEVRKNELSNQGGLVKTEALIAKKTNKVTVQLE